MLMLPRGYMSPTQMNMWETDQKKYIRNYILNIEKGFSTKYTEYGNKFGTAMETDEDTDDDMINLAKEIVPKYKEPEKILEAILDNGEVWFMMMGKLDTYEDEPLRFREYKTGRPKWTQARADNLDQVTHYATLIYLLEKRLPEEIHLDWLQTDIDENGNLYLTGHYEEFAVKKRLQDILVYMARAIKVAKEIDEIYRKHLSGIKII